MVFNLHANFQSVPYFSLTDLSEKFTVLWLQRQQPPGTVCLHSILMLQTATLGCVIKALTPDPLRDVTRLRKTDSTLCLCLHVLWRSCQLSYQKEAKYAFYGC